MFPRSGGVYEQDPILMRDFRLIRKFEVDWKNAQHEIEKNKKQLGQAVQSSGQGGGFNLEELLDALEGEI